MDGDEFCFSTGKSAQEMGLSHVPTCYMVDPSQRPSLSPSPSHANVPIFDLAGLHSTDSARSLVVHGDDKTPSNARIRRLALELTEVITESLGLGPTYLTHKMAQGMQVMALNCYPEPELALGLPPHSEYSCFTILLQSSQGLEIGLPVEDGPAPPRGPSGPCGGPRGGAEQRDIQECC
ncbi:hypothetical protein V2J09_008170 [Rumex salicifolius]